MMETTTSPNEKRTETTGACEATRVYIGGLETRCDLETLVADIGDVATLATLPTLATFADLGDVCRPSATWQIPGASLRTPQH